MNIIYFDKRTQIGDSQTWGLYILDIMAGFAFCQGRLYFTEKPKRFNKLMFEPLKFSVKIIELIFWYPNRQMLMQVSPVQTGLYAE